MLRRTIGIGGLAIALLALSPRCQAQATFSWNAGSGSFHTKENWNPTENAPPSVSDLVRFESGSGAKTVAFAQDVTTSSLSVVNDNVTFQMGPNRYDAGGIAIDSDGRLVLEQGTLDANGRLAVGVFSSGELLIQDTLLTSSAELAATNTSTATVDVVGEDALWENNGVLLMGSGLLGADVGGQATVNIREGASLSTVGGSLGHKSPSHATVNIDGVPATARSRIDFFSSRWESTSTIEVGDQGRGTLNLTNGGSAVAPVFHLGVGAGSVGEVNVDGAAGFPANNPLFLIHSALVTEDLIIGRAGSAHLTVTGGGGVGSSDVFNPRIGFVDVADAVGGAGTLLISGTGEEERSQFNADQFVLGKLGAAKLDVTAGAVVNTTNSYVATGVGSTAVINIQGSAPGAPSTWQVDDRLTLGGDNLGAGGASTLSVTDGGQLLVGSQGVTAWDGSSVTINGGTLKTQGGFDNSHGGSLTFRDGTFEVSGGPLHYATTPQRFFLIGDTATSSPHLIIGGGATTSNIEQLSIGVFTDARLTVKDGGRFAAEQIFGSGSMVVENGGQVRLDNFARTVGSTEIRITGASSSWVQTNDFSLAQDGNTELLVADGGALSNGDAALGAGPGGTAIATVTGSGSHWNSSGALRIGAGGRGELHILEGGIVSVAGGLLIDDGAGDGGSLINIAAGGELALYGRADATLSEFLDLIDGTDRIRYWDELNGNWSDISGAVRGEHFELEFNTFGVLAGYTSLTVFPAAPERVPEPGSVLLLLCATLATALPHRTFADR